MATRNIALGINVKVNGTQQTVKSIDDLKTAISQLESEIETADFGSDEFNKLSADLAKLKSGFRDINKEIEGADREQQLGAFAASVNGVTGAFLVATSAVQAFGIEGKTNEELQKIQARALAAVNVALGIRQIVEAKVKFEQIQRNVAEKASIITTNLLAAAQRAYTVVVGTSTGALKAFRIALASTGIGLAVVGLGFLISKLMGAKDETEELTTETNALAEAQLKAEQSTVKETTSIESLSRALNDSTQPQKVREELYKSLTKLVPELAGYTLDEAENTGILNKAIKEQIELIRLRAEVRALEELLVEQVKAQIAAEREYNETAEEREEIIQEQIDLQNQYNTAKENSFDVGVDEYYVEAEAIDEVNEKTKEGTQIKEEELTLEEKLALKQQELAEILAKITARIEERSKQQKAQNKLLKEQEERLKALDKAYEDASKALGTFTLEGEVSASVIEQANKLLKEQQDILEERKTILQEQTTQAEDAAAQLTRLIGGIIVPEKGIVKTFEDVFKDIFDSVEQSGGSALEQYEKLQQKVEELGGVEAVRNQIGQESLLILQDYFQTNVELLDRIDDYNVAAIGAGKELIDINFDVQKLVQDISDIRREGQENLERESITEEKIFQLVSDRLFPQTKLNDLTDEQKSTIDEMTKSLLEQEKIYQGIDDVNAQLEKRTKKIGENITAQSEALDEEAFGNLREFIKANAQSINEIEKTFKTISEGSSNLTEEQIENINKLIEDIKTNNIVTRVNEISQAVIGVFTNLSGQLSSIVSQANSLLLEQLQYEQEVTLANIGDATEEARAEREMVEKDFAKRRFELEKDARISELQFARADAIANGAAAYIQALTLPPPAGFLLAQLVGGLTAQQLAVINSQIGFTKSKQFLGRRGGLISGADHENGGVMMGGGLVLEGGEAVINRQAVGQFGDILNQVQLATNGRPLYGDDSRIVEEIRKQNQRPIKTYVLDQDIQDTRKINNRLEQISRL